jgi:hypothetical protein
VETTDLGGILLKLFLVLLLSLPVAATLMNYEGFIVDYE